MTQLLIDRATLEKALDALNDTTGFPSTGARSFDNRIMSIRALRAALANVEPAGWQTLVDHGKEAHELAKIMKDFADKNPESLMLKELDN